VDLYFAPFDNVFVVNVDSETGFHQVSIDPRYRYTSSHAPTSAARARRDTDNATLDSAGANWTDKVHELVERSATQLVTFVSVTHSEMFLVVRRIRHRLVMMLPNTAHRLKVSRFYLVLSGASNSSSGIIYFRQDQPHIDLFVFFSVFFSCFFLFLAACVMLWKAKQAVDRQRSRHRRQIEMHDMASRPFATVLVYLPPASDEPPTESSSSQEAAQPDRAVDGALRLGAVAVEPTRGLVSVVATVVVELPCRCSAPVRACLGSCLLTARSLHAQPAAHHVTTKHGTRPRTSVT